MTVPSLFKEYIWLVNIIKRARRITFAEIQEKWLNTEMSGGVELARSTFNRHKEAIQEIFGICINCDRKGGCEYYIDNEYVLHEDTVQNWIISTLSVNEIVSEYKSLHERIVLQQIPCEEHLQTFISAMKKKVCVSIKYRMYGSDYVSSVVFEPYCLKLFNQRWYVLAHFYREHPSENEDRDFYAIYSFDRILEISLTNDKFEVRDDFNAQDYFKDSFGMFAGDDIFPQRVILRVYGKQRYYFQDLPLHNSQKEIGRGENYVDYEYYIRPTPDFCGQILSLVNQVKVLHPISLADKIRNMALDTLEMYDEED